MWSLKRYVISFTFLRFLTFFQNPKKRDFYVFCFVTYVVSNNDANYANCANYANFVVRLSVANAYLSGNGQIGNNAGCRERPQRCWATQTTSVHKHVELMYLICVATSRKRSSDLYYKR